MINQILMNTMPRNSSKLKNLLLEGRYDGLTTYASRKIVQLIKQNKKRARWNLRFPRGFEYEDGIEFPLFIEFQINITYGKNPNDIVGSVYDDETAIRLDLVIDPATIPQALNQLIPDIKETIMHELEHIAQNIGLRGSAFNQYEEYKNLSDYFLSNKEIPAFVRGLYKSAKTLRKPLDFVFDRTLNYYRDRLSSEEINTIKRTWAKYAKENLPSARWSV